ncbi:MAG: hypothetical protein D6719_06510 [Candidatus Dadabacteria bacterium]|nr:MAG: hypothetical protein D6719_06510 [Candidatus Dadabacteria bacterium]
MYFLMKQHHPKLTFVTLLLWGKASIALACSCIPAKEAQYLKNAQIAFEGQALDIQEVEKAQSQWSGSVKITFKVTKTIKGSDKDQVSVTTNKSSAACGYPFQRGQFYRVYAYTYKGQLTTGLCSGTRPLSTKE